MVIWQGAGIIGIIIPVIFCLLGNLGLDLVMGSGYYSSHKWAPTLFLGLSAAAIWVIGYGISKIPGEHQVDPVTKKYVLVKPSHTLFFMPLQYFAFVVAAFAVWMLFPK
ncbi:MAG: hypothetical protein V4857_03435 [Pseudomonadota bacterium]